MRGVNVERKLGYFNIDISGPGNVERFPGVAGKMRKGGAMTSMPGRFG
jgi:hypothetical protein